MYTSSGVRVHGQQQAIAGDFRIGDYYISVQKFGEMIRYEVFPGEVLVTVMGTIGRVAVVPDGVERGIINPRLVRHQANLDQVSPAFLRMSILGDLSQARLKLMAQGSTMEGLNMQILGDLPIALPPLDEQCQILTGSSANGASIRPRVVVQLANFNDFNLLQIWTTTGDRIDLRLAGLPD